MWHLYIESALTVLHNVTDHMLEQALEIISYNSQMTLTPGECIIKN